MNGRRATNARHRANVRFPPKADIVACVSQRIANRSIMTI